MSFDILNKLFPDNIPDASDFFAHDPQHGFSVSTVMGLTGKSNYLKAYEHFVTEHWLPTRTAVDKVLADVKVLADDVKVVVTEVDKVITEDGKAPAEEAKVEDKATADDVKVEVKAPVAEQVAAATKK